MLKGSCLCGSIRYQLEKLATPIQHCSCHTCRKAQGAAFATVAGVARDDFQWLAGEQLLSSYESSPGKLRYFCSQCGSHLLADKQTAPYVVLRVATLDDDPKTKPVAQIWQSHEVDWLDYGDHIPAHAQWPPGH